MKIPYASNPYKEDLAKCWSQAYKKAESEDKKSVTHYAEPNERFNNKDGSRVKWLKKPRKRA